MGRVAPTRACHGAVPPSHRSAPPRAGQSRRGCARPMRARGIRLEHGPDRAAARGRAQAWLDARDAAGDEGMVRFRYLVAMVARRAGLPREVGRAGRGGRRRVSFVDPVGGATYAVVDPGLRSDEAPLLDATAWVLFGGADPRADG